MTVSIPKWVIAAIGVVFVAAVGVGIAYAAGAFEPSEPPEVCVSDSSGDEIDCDASNAVSQAEFDAEEAEEAAQEAEDLAEAQAVQAACESEIGPLVRALEDLDSRLDVGVSYDEYGTKVGDVNSAYGQINFKSLDVDCVTQVGIGAEGALNDYVKANNVWSDCFSDFDCDIDSIDPQLQSKWQSASTKTQEASRGLEQLGRP